MSNKNQYKWEASDYAAHSENQNLWADELIAKLKFKGDEQILDVGCGDGKITARLAQQVPFGSVLGIDNSDSMIRLCLANYPKREYGNLSFELADVREIESTEKYDAIFSNAVLHWIKNHELVLKKLANSLKHKGKILLQMGGMGNASGILTVLDELITSDKWKFYFQNFQFPYAFYSCEEYQPLLDSAGLKAIRN